MVALRSQGNWRWEGPLGTPLGVVHWKRDEFGRVDLGLAGGTGKCIEHRHSQRLGEEKACKV